MLKGFPDLPPVWLLATMIFSWGLGKLAVLALPGWAHGLGFVLILLGLAVIAWAAIWFLRKRTPIEPHHTARALIVEGPFRVSRNPIYLALLIIAAGFALRQGTALALLPVPLLWVVLDRRFAGPEEAGLRAAFGDEAETYLARTRRWL